MASRNVKANPQLVPFRWHAAVPSPPLRVASAFRCTIILCNLAVYNLCRLECVTPLKSKLVLSVFSFNSNYATCMVSVKLGSHFVTSTEYKAVEGVTSGCGKAYIFGDSNYYHYRAVNGWGWKSLRFSSHLLFFHPNYVNKHRPLQHHALEWS